MDDRRQYERKQVRSDKIPGEFYLDVNGERHTFIEVEDVSITGMGMLLPVQLDNGQAVQLGYSDHGEPLVVSARVAWAVPSRTGQGIRTGIHFDTTDMDSNVLFFMTLREYIDDFGEGF